MRQRIDFIWQSIILLLLLLGTAGKKDTYITFSYSRTPLVSSLGLLLRTSYPKAFVRSFTVGVSPESLLVCW